MEEIKIVMPGQCMVKKNGAKTSVLDKTGKPRAFPLHYYSEPYKKWAKSAIIACANFKVVTKGIDFPLQGQYNLRILFIFDNQKVVDLSNLYEGVQDVLTGNAGVCADQVPKSYYQILEDDNVRYVGGHDGSRFLYLPAEKPRTEVYITDFNY